MDINDEMRSNRRNELVSVDVGTSGIGWKPTSENVRVEANLG